MTQEEKEISRSEIVRNPPKDIKRYFHPPTPTKKSNTIGTGNGSKLNSEMYLKIYENISQPHEKNLSLSNPNNKEKILCKDTLLPHHIIFIVHFFIISLPYQLLNFLSAFKSFLTLQHFVIVKQIFQNKNSSCMFSKERINQSHLQTHSNLKNANKYSTLPPNQQTNNKQTDNTGKYFNQKY